MTQKDLLLTLQLKQSTIVLHWLSFHWLITAVTHARAKVPNPVAVKEEICNLFGTSQCGFQVAMKHGVAEEQNSCVFRFRRSHVRTRLLHSTLATNSLALRHLWYAEEERVWNSFQDTCLSVVGCQTWMLRHFTCIRAHTVSYFYCTF